MSKSALRFGDVVLARQNVLVPSLGYRVPAGYERPLLVIGPPEGSASARFPDVRVAPLDLRLDMAGPQDVLLAPSESPLNRDAMVSLWAARPALVANLTSPIGRLAETAMRRVVAVHNARYGETGVLLDWEGPVIATTDDPRLSFRRAELESLAFLVDPVDDALRLSASPHRDTCPRVFLCSGESGAPQAWVDVGCAAVRQAAAHGWHDILWVAHHGASDTYTALETANRILSSVLLVEYATPFAVRHWLVNTVHEYVAQTEVAGVLKAWVTPEPKRGNRVDSTLTARLTKLGPADAAEYVS